MTRQPLITKGRHGTQSTPRAWEEWSMATLRGKTEFGASDCKCSILNAREEKLLDDEGRVEIRLVCNRCGTVLDSEIITAKPIAAPETAREAAEGA